MKPKNKKPILVILTGYSGAGKTTLSHEFGKKHDFIVLSEDNFVFDMSPYSLNPEVASNENRKFGMLALEATLKEFMKSKKSIIVEGALVDGPLFPKDFNQLAKNNGYDFLQITLIADRKCRVKRKKHKNGRFFGKKGHVISDELDHRLRTAADSLGYLDEDIAIINNTKKSFASTLSSLESLLGLVD